MRAKCTSRLQVLGETMHEVYNLLKRVHASERDQLTRAHADRALTLLDDIMRQQLFPHDHTHDHTGRHRKKMEKKIQVLSVS